MQGPARSQIDQKANQAAWLLKAITCIDLTTLSGDDTENRVRGFVERVVSPCGEIFSSNCIDPGSITTGAICVYHEMVGAAVRALEGSGIPVAAVSTGFPAGLSPIPCAFAEISESVDAGAEEIDIVISRRHAHAELAGPLR